MAVISLSKNRILPFEAILSKSGESWVVGGVASNFFRDLDGDAIAPDAIARAIPAFMANRGPDGLKGGPLRLHHGFWERFLKQSINSLNIPYADQMGMLAAIALPLGRVTEMTVEPDGTTRWRGLLSQANPIAKVIWEMLKEGLVHLGVSVGGKINATRPGRDALGRPCTVICDVRLDELSITDNPANRLIESEAADNGAYIMALAKSLQTTVSPSPVDQFLEQMLDDDLAKAARQRMQEGATRMKNGRQEVLKNSRWRPAGSGNSGQGTTPTAKPATKPARKPRAKAAPQQLSLIPDGTPSRVKPKARKGKQWGAAQQPQAPAAVGGAAMGASTLRPKKKAPLPQPTPVGNDDIFEKPKAKGKGKKKAKGVAADLSAKRDQKAKGEGSKLATIATKDREIRDAFAQGQRGGKNPGVLTSTVSDAFILGKFLADNNISGEAKKGRGSSWAVGSRSFKVNGDDVTEAGGDAPTAASPKKNKTSNQPISQNTDKLAPSVTGSPDDDARLANYEAKAAKGRLSDRLQFSYERLQKMRDADPAAWKPGDTVGFKVVSGGRYSQTNKGFQVVSVDPKTKMATLRMVKDTGLTSTGGNEGVGKVEVHIADLQRDRSSSKRLKKTGTTMAKVNRFLHKALGGSPGGEINSGSWRDTAIPSMGRGLGANSTNKPTGTKPVRLDASSSDTAARGIGGKQPKAQRTYSSGGMPPTDVWGMTVGQLTRELSKCCGMTKDAWGSPETSGFLTDAAHGLVGLTESPHPELINFVRFLQYLNQFAQQIPHMDDYQAAGTVAAMKTDLTKALGDFTETLPAELKGRALRPPGSPGVRGIDIQFPSQYIVYS